MSRPAQELRTSPVTTDADLTTFITRYKKSRRPITVSFRNLVGIPNSDRATHLIHPYPAKLLTHIPIFFLANSILSKPGDIVLDPFCGSGTVLLEAMLMGRNALGVDVNPLARLISRVKVNKLDAMKLRRGIERLKSRIPETSNIRVPDVVNIRYWFYPHVIRDLLRLSQAIKATRDDALRSYFLVCFSSCVRKVSLADPRLSVPVRLRKDQYPVDHWLRLKTEKHLKYLRRVNVFAEFDKILENNFRRMISLNALTPSGVCADVIGLDARALRFDTKHNGRSNTRLRKNAVDLIITSPPYNGAQKYIRASSLSLGWLELCTTPELQSLHSASIGREQHRKKSYEQPLQTEMNSANRALKRIRAINPLRAHIAATYLSEMRAAFSEMARTLKPNGYLVLIAGNNRVCGQTFRTQQYLKKIAEEVGFTLILKLVDEIRSRGLMTKRNRTASVITREWVLVFKNRSYGRTRRASIRKNQDPK